MRKVISRSLIFFLSVVIIGCATQEPSAVFITSTSLSVIEGDTKPPGASIGYKRIEGYIGPNNADGSAPPILASIETDGKILNQKIRQLYATGGAAVIASGSAGQYSEPDADGKKSHTMFFGTSTNLGLSFGTTANVLDSFNFGYKRKELSVIPLIKDKQEGYVYPSVLASIDTTGGANVNATEADLELKTSQYFLQVLRRGT